MTYEPKHLKRWTMPDSYIGSTWPDYYSSSVGQSRDSDALERSNFQCMLDALNGESETVLVIRENHWAVGWVEWIAIHYTDYNALMIADDIAESLQDYPVIDEGHYSELEMEEANEVWKNCYNDQSRLEYVRKHRDQFDFPDYEDMISCIRGKYFVGYASDLLY
jgi:hypothetical protein